MWVGKDLCDASQDQCMRGNRDLGTMASHQPQTSGLDGLPQESEGRIQPGTSWVPCSRSG